jgi:hypothetical protein
MKMHVSLETPLRTLSRCERLLTCEMPLSTLDFTIAKKRNVRNAGLTLDKLYENSQQFANHISKL